MINYDENKTVHYIAVDFDGTLTEQSKFPKIGKKNNKIIVKLMSRIAGLTAEGKQVKIILWTCRSEEQLEAAVKWCAENLNFKIDFVNENSERPTGSPKIYANEYWDDKAVNAIEKECMMSKKYEMIYDRNVGLHRIRALRDFSDVKSGDYGGFVESEKNLSHNGNCWIYDTAAVVGSACLCDDAKISGDGKVEAGLKVNIKNIFDVAKQCVGRSAQIGGSVSIYGYVKIRDRKTDFDLWVI